LDCVTTLLYICLFNHIHKLTTMKFLIVIQTTYNYYFTSIVVAPSQIAAFRIARKLASQKDSVHKFYADPV
jgi:hypothetical protein